MTTTLQRAPQVRWCIARDLPDILDFESRDPAGWTEVAIRETLQRRECIAVVAEAGESVVAYMVYELKPKRFDVLRLAVRADWRRRGIGSLLLGRLADKLSCCRRERVRVEVPETNLPAQLFLRACGYLAVGMADGVIRFVYRKGASQ